MFAFCFTELMMWLQALHPVPTIRREHGFIVIGEVGPFMMLMS